MVGGKTGRSVATPGFEAGILWVPVSPKLDAK